MLLGKVLYQPVLPQVHLTLILDIMVKGDHGLLGIVNLCSFQALPFLHSGKRVIMCHDFVRLQGELVSGLDKFPFRQADSVSLYDLLCERLGGRASLSQ